MRIRPIKDNVLVKIENPNYFNTFLELPESYEYKSNVGRVLAYGPGRLNNGNRIAVEVQEGDKVIFDRFKGIELQIGKEDYVILPERHIWVITERKNESIRRTA